MRPEDPLAIVDGPGRTGFGEDPHPPGMARGARRVYHRTRSANV